MDLNNIDYHTLCIEEGGNFYSGISELDKQTFNQWIAGNLKELTTIDSYDSVLPSKEIINKITERGYQHVHYQCHYSAKAATIFDENLKYYTGFIKRNHFYNFITHSFNFDNSQIVDFARIENPDDKITSAESGLPNVYYGIEIPREFVTKFKRETIEYKSMNPLLKEWFLENN